MNKISFEEAHESLYFLIVVGEKRVILCFSQASAVISGKKLHPHHFFLLLSNEERRRDHKVFFSWICAVGELRYEKKVYLRRMKISLLSEMFFWF